MYLSLRQSFAISRNLSQFLAVSLCLSLSLHSLSLSTLSLSLYPSPFLCLSMCLPVYLPTCKEALLGEVTLKKTAQFFISHSTPAALANLLFDPPEPQNIGKNKVFRDVSTSSRALILFLSLFFLSCSLTFSLLRHHFCRICPYVGFLTSKLPSIVMLIQISGVWAPPPWWFMNIYDDPQLSRPTWRIMKSLPWTPRSWSTGDPLSWQTFPRSETCEVHFAWESEVLTLLQWLKWSLDFIRFGSALDLLWIRFIYHLKSSYISIPPFRTRNHLKICGSKTHTNACV